MTMPKGKQDILGDVLTSIQESSFPGVDELSGLIQSTGSARVQKPKPPRTSRGSKNHKKKATHYLSPETYESLARTLPQIRKLVPERLRRQISKSRLVDSGMSLLLQEFEEKGAKSLLVKRFLKRKQD